MSLTLDEFFALPRVASLHLSPDGRRLVATVQTVAADGKRFAGALWDIDPDGRRPARRLTHSAKGETAAGFLPDGSILFTSPRPDVESAEGTAPEAPVLYVLPAAGGEPRKVCAPQGGVEQVVTGRNSTTVVLAIPVHPGTATAEDDEKREKARKDAGVEALLFEHYPMSWWDHPLAGREPHLMALDLADLDAPIAAPRDLTPDVPWPGWLADTGLDLSADGSFLILGARLHSGADVQIDLVRIDLASGERRVLLHIDGDHDGALISPDGRLVALSRYHWGAPDRPAREELLLVDPTGGEPTQLAPDWDGHWTDLVWAPDSSALFVATEEGGRGPVYRLELDGTRTRLTAEGTYSNLRPSPDGTTLYALRAHVGAPPAVVALDARAADQEPRFLRGPAEAPALGTRLEEMTVPGAGGTPIHAWLVLPETASAAEPAPLALFIHGGPFNSWSGWTWRWNPHVLAGRGYAVLLPDPHLSTGYGRALIDQSWNDWSVKPYADIMACVDAAVARPDIDAERTAAMGGSYGGYMANWVAGHTDRFRAIVTHASVWALDSMHGTTDYGPFLERQLGSPVTEFESWMAHSPHRSADGIRTPMLVIHGERDRRVPPSEAVRLWTDLQLRGVPSKLLWFPDENHWVLKPQNARLWYQTVLAFLDHHVLGKPWVKPELI